MTEKRSFPTDPVTGKPIRDLEQPGYYPGYSTLGQQMKWDETTRHAVLKRVTAAPALKFFQQEEAELLSAIIDRVLPQDDRAAGKTIPILPEIDERLTKNALHGFRYEEMPPDREAYRMGLVARVRHYWSKVDYKEYFTLTGDGGLAKNTTFTGNENQAVDFFNVDMTYTWEFAPGSFLNIVWKNATYMANDLVRDGYLKNFTNTLQSDQNNNLSVKVIYFLDYLKLKKKRP